MSVKIGIIGGFSLLAPRTNVVSSKIREQLVTSLRIHLLLVRKGYEVSLPSYDGKDLKDLDICLVIDRLPSEDIIDFKAFQNIPRRIYLSAESLPWDKEPHSQQIKHLSWFRAILKDFKPHAAILSTSDQYDPKLLTSYFNVDLKGCEILWSSLYYDPLFHCDFKRKNRRKDAVLHYGTYSKYRINVIKIFNESPSLSVAHYGKLWGMEKLDVLNTFAVAISIHSGSLRHFPVARTCELYACGCLPIYENLDNLVKFKSEDIVQCSIEEMPEVCEYYLEHDTERQEMVKRGQDLVKKYFSIEVFIDQLLGDFR